MSESSFPAQVPAQGPSSLVAGGQYTLSDDLARLCLPQEYKDSYRRLAWVNSICLMFLVVGLIGLKPPKVHVRPISEPTDAVPVVFTPPEEPPKAEPDVKPDEPPPPQENPEETPQVAQVVAVADPASVAFPVAVPGAVTVASAAHLATPPPLVSQPPARPAQFNPAAEGGGDYPPPEYPPIALRNRWGGTVTIEIMVDASGRVTSAKVQKSSGKSPLDDAALEVVHRWHFPPGKPRWLYWPCFFNMQG